FRGIRERLGRALKELRPTIADDEAKVAIWGGGARPDWHCLAYPRPVDQRWRCALASDGRRCAGRGRHFRAQGGAGAHRIAGQRHPDRQRRHQGAGRYHDHGGPFPRRRRSEEGRFAVHARWPCHRSADRADRDVARYTDLVAKSATPVINLDNAKTQADVFRAAIKSDQGLLDNLKVQLSYCTITAPIDGRISAAAVKVGNFVRQADTAAMATINQMAPVYVSFTVPQKVLPEIRQALAAETATIEAVVPGEQKRANGQVTMIENTVDPTTGMATIRATMPNEHEVLWPGTLVTAELTLRIEQAVVVPSNSVQVSQTGNFVFVISD